MSSLKKQVTVCIYKSLPGNDFLKYTLIIEPIVIFLNELNSSI